MFTKSLLTLSISKASGMRHTIQILILALILTGITVACATTAQSAANPPGESYAVVQVSDVLPLSEPVVVSPAAHLPGHDFGAIYGSIDPGTSLRADPPPFVYWVNGQMVVRRSELGPLTDPVSNPVADPVVVSPRVLGPGRDFGAIYGSVDPGANQAAALAIDPQPLRGPGHDFGAIYGTVDPGANPTAAPAIVPQLVRGSGHDYGAIYGSFDPGKGLPITVSPFTFMFHGRP